MVVSCVKVLDVWFILIFCLDGGWLRHGESQHFKTNAAQVTALPELYEAARRKHAGTHFRHDHRRGAAPQPCRCAQRPCSSAGKPKVGYNTEALIAELEEFLGYNDVDDAIIVGAGKLGKALLTYGGFKDCGMNIVAAFDIDEEVCEEDYGGKRILTMDKLMDLCERMRVRIGIIAVPAENAQAICNLLIESGILAIWNFAPVHLDVPEGILVHNENLAASLAILSKQLKEKFDTNT